MAVFSNQATLSYNGNVTGSNIITGEIVEVLSAAKTAVTGDYSANGETAFVISLVNTGNSDYTDITVVDNLGEYTPENSQTSVVPLTYVPDSVTCYVNGVKSTAPTVSLTDPLKIENITVPAQGNTLIIYTAKANQYAPLGENQSITNTATISGTGISSEIQAQSTITPETGIDLAITKAVSPTSVPENGKLTYTFTIQNFGSTEAQLSDNIIFRDTFNPILTGLTATFNGQTWTATTNYTYSQSTGEFVSADNQITVPSATYTQDAQTCAWSVEPGVSTLVISGNISS